MPRFRFEPYWSKGWNWLFSHIGLGAYKTGEMWAKYSTWVRFLRLERDYEGLIIDIGCGKGGHSIWLAQQFPKSTVIGVDVQKSSIEIAVKHQRDLGIRNVYFLIGSLKNLPFAANTFSKGLSCQVYEHLPPPLNEEMLGEVHRVLKQGGNFVLNTPGPLFLTYRFPFYRLILRLRPNLRHDNLTLKYYSELGTYDSWQIHDHVKPGFYPWEIFAKLPWGLAPIEFKFLMKYLGAFWFELTSVNRRYRVFFLPLSYLFFWIDNFLPGEGFDLSIRIQKLADVPKHVLKN